MAQIDVGRADAAVGITDTTETVSYLYSDHLMTTRLASDQSQAIIWRWQGEAFGNTPAEELATISINLRFPGQYYDEETNLHYNHYWYYDPSLGRYITSDPIGLEGGMNTYNYANVNPIIYTDALGLFPGPGGSITDLPAWIPEWGSGIDPSGGTSGSGSSGPGGNDECDDQDEGEEDCLQKALNSYSLEISINRIAGFGIGSAIVGGGAQVFNKTAIKPRKGVGGGGPSGRYTSRTRRRYGNGIGKTIGRVPVGVVAKASGIIGAGVGAWSLHGEALLIYLKCLEENR